MEKGKTVLIVDDDAPIRAFVKQALAGEGYDVQEAADGAAALAALERELVDLVLLDLWMPVMDGWQFAEAFKRLDERALPGKKPPLVVFTAERGLAAAQHADQLRAAGFLTKPFDIQELLDVVQRCVQRGRDGGPDGAGPNGAGPTGGPETRASDAPGVPRNPPSGERAEPGLEKLTREEIQRQQHVNRLRARLARLQEDMGRVRTGVTKVAEIEVSRKLTREEARWASQLRMQSEQLRYELQLLREEFYTLRDERGDGGARRAS